MGISLRFKLLHIIFNHIQIRYGQDLVRIRLGSCDTAPQCQGSHQQNCVEQKVRFAYEGYGKVLSWPLIKVGGCLSIVDQENPDIMEGDMVTAGVLLAQKLLVFVKILLQQKMLKIKCYLPGTRICALSTIMKKIVFNLKK